MWIWHPHRAHVGKGQKRIDWQFQAKPRGGWNAEQGAKFKAVFVLRCISNVCDRPTHTGGNEWVRPGAVWGWNHQMGSARNWREGCGRGLGKCRLWASEEASMWAWIGQMAVPVGSSGGLGMGPKRTLMPGKPAHTWRGCPRDPSALHLPLRARLWVFDFF